MVFGLACWDKVGERYSTCERPAACQKEFAAGADVEVVVPGPGGVGGELDFVAEADGLGVGGVSIGRS